MNALIYTRSGGGKTVNTTLTAAPNRGKNLLICTDNSSIVLKNFDRPNLVVKTVDCVKDFRAEYVAGYESKQYDNIIVDNLSDLFDMWILELTASAQFKDPRQAYKLVYDELKRLSRESTRLDCHTIFTAWVDYQEITLPTGETALRMYPKLPLRILDNVCGLMNVVGFINSTEKDGKKIWYYALEDTPTLMAKDQIACRKTCMPADLFLPKKKG